MRCRSNARCGGLGCHRHAGTRRRRRCRRSAAPRGPAPAHRSRCRAIAIGRRRRSRHCGKRRRRSSRTPRRRPNRRQAGGRPCAGCRRCPAPGAAPPNRSTGRRDRRAGRRRTRSRRRGRGRRLRRRRCSGPPPTAAGRTVTNQHRSRPSGSRLARRRTAQGAHLRAHAHWHVRGTSTPNRTSPSSGWSTGYRPICGSSTRARRTGRRSNGRAWSSRGCWHRWVADSIAHRPNDAGGRRWRPRRRRWPSGKGRRPPRSARPARHSRTYRPSGPVASTRGWSGRRGCPRWASPAGWSRAH